MKRRDRHREYYSVFIMILLDRCRRCPANTNTVTAHYNIIVFSVRIEEGRLHRFGVFGAEFEDMPNLDPAGIEITPPTFRTTITSLGVTQIGKLLNLEIALEINPFEMDLLLIAADTDIAHILQGIIGVDRQLETDRTGETERPTGRLNNLRRGGEFNHRRAEQIFYFRFIELMVTTDQHRNQLFIGRDNHRLDDLLWLKLEQFGDIGDSVRTLGHHPLDVSHLSGRVIPFVNHDRLLNIGSVITAITTDHHIFAGIGQYHEFVTERTTDSAGVGIDHPIFQTAGLKDLAVGIAHLLITVVGTLFGRIERVGILHNKFTTTHQTEPRTNFITKLGLDLIEINRQLAIRLDVTANNIGNHLFMGRSHTEIALMPILETKQFATIESPPP